jgi:hypothetical protein
VAKTNGRKTQPKQHPGKQWRPEQDRTAPQRRTQKRVLPPWEQASFETVRKCLQVVRITLVASRLFHAA